MKSDKMDTNNSKYTKEDLREVRKDLDPNLSDRHARKENRERRKNIARRTRRLEKREFKRLVENEKYEDVIDFYKK